MRPHDFIEHDAREIPGAEFVIFGDRRLTLAEADRLAKPLVEAGLRVMPVTGVSCGILPQTLNNNSQCGPWSDGSRLLTEMLNESALRARGGG